MFAALLLNRPQRQLRVRPVEKPAGGQGQEQERRNLWEELLLNVHSAVRWKVRLESRGGAGRGEGTLGLDESVSD